MLKSADSSILNTQHDWRDLYDNLVRTRILTLIVHKIFKEAPQIMRQMAMGANWICYLMHCLRVSYPREVGAKKKASK